MSKWVVTAEFKPCWDGYSETDIIFESRYWLVTYLYFHYWMSPQAWMFEYNKKLNHLLFGRRPAKVLETDDTTPFGD